MTKRKCKSALGIYLVPMIKKFIIDNSKSVSGGTTLEVSADAISNAIEYGWSLAWSSTIMQTSFVSGIAPPPVPPSTVTIGGPVGSLIYNALKPQCLET